MIYSLTNCFLREEISTNIFHNHFRYVFLVTLKYEARMSSVSYVFKNRKAKSRCIGFVFLHVKSHKFQQAVMVVIEAPKALLITRSSSFDVSSRFWMIHSKSFLVSSNIVIFEMKYLTQSQKIATKTKINFKIEIVNLEIYMTANRKQLMECWRFALMKSSDELKLYNSKKFQSPHETFFYPISLPITP